MTSLPDLVTTSLAEAASLDAALRLVLDHFQAELGTVHLLESDGLLHLRSAVPGLPDPVRAVVERIPIGKGMAGLAVERAAPVTICNLQTDASGDAKPGARATGMEGSLVVPIMDGERAVGALGIANREPRTFTETEQAILLEAGRRFSAVSR